MVPNLIGFRDLFPRFWAPPKGVPGAGAGLLAPGHLESNLPKESTLEKRSPTVSPHVTTGGPPVAPVFSVRGPLTEPPKEGATLAALNPKVGDLNAGLLSAEATEILLRV